MNTLEIEWKHLDVEGKTCNRCCETENSLQEIIEELADECKSSGWEIKLKETKLTPEDISESNVILLNGKPLEELIPEARASESHCGSCSEIVGKTTSCRTVEVEGTIYGGIPASVIRKAVCQVTKCC